ncbi:Transposase IS4, partial [Popillia japonica]
MLDTERNRNALQTKQKNGPAKTKSRLSCWNPTTLQEMKQFIGLLLYIGLVKYPMIERYWSKKPTYKNAVAPRIMPRNRFRALLRFWHFANNEDPAAEDNHLHKITKLELFNSR